MNEFEFLAVFISIVVGLGVTHILLGLARIIHARDQQPVSSLHMVWTINVLLILLLNWWVLFLWADFLAWSFDIYLLLIGWGIFFIFDHNTQIAAASGNLLVFIAFNFTVGDSLPRLGYLTFLDSIMLTGFLASITSLLLALYLKRIESNGRAEYAKVVERHALLTLPPSFGAVVALLIVYFFFIL